MYDGFFRSNSYYGGGSYGLRDRTPDPVIPKRLHCDTCDVTFKSVEKFADHFTHCNRKKRQKTKEKKRKKW